MNGVIYLDNNSTTEIDARVLEAMMPYFTDAYGNASSTHLFGQRIKKAVNQARERVANLIGANEREITFTSGATESINLVLKGFALANQGSGKHIVAVETEHKAVLDTCKYLETIGFEVSYLSTKRDGLIDLERLKNELRNDTILVCVMLANNEIGVLQPLKEIAHISHDAGAFVMSDATQAVGKISVNVIDTGIDFLAFSAHKFHGAKGAGALYINSKSISNKRLTPLMHGGGHENGMRSGTLNVPAIVGFGMASELAKNEMIQDESYIGFLRDDLETKLLLLENSFINGNKTQRMHNVSNICFEGIDANVLIGMMKNVAVSNGSACSSAIVEPSHVLKAIGLSDDEANGSIRFSLSKFNTQQEINDLISIFKSNLALQHIT